MLCHVILCSLVTCLTSSLPQTHFKNLSFSLSKTIEMADSQGMVDGGSFSQLLFADDVVVLDQGTGGNCFNNATVFSTENQPKMLCFGDHYSNVVTNLNINAEITRTPQKSGVTYSDSSSTSSINDSNTKSQSKSNKKRNGLVANESVQSLTTGAGAPAGNQRTHKKNKSDNSMGIGHAKVKKENLGERISALQQIVSPYGKTDTASVLHEAMGYIRFLQEQVQVLCSPYLHDGGEKGEGESRKDLRNRGLCLVPLDCTVHVANTNGADFWSNSMENSASKH